MIALFSMPAYALNLNQAKAQGKVKESPGGYLVEVEASSEVKALVARINAARRAEYQKIADKRGISRQAVEQMAGAKLVQ